MGEIPLYLSKTFICQIRAMTVNAFGWFKNNAQTFLDHSCLKVIFALNLKTSAFKNPQSKFSKFQAVLGHLGPLAFCWTRS